MEYEIVYGYKKWKARWYYKYDKNEQKILVESRKADLPDYEDYVDVSYFGEILCFCPKCQKIHAMPRKHSDFWIDAIKKSENCEELEEWEDVWRFSNKIAKQLIKGEAPDAKIILRKKRKGHKIPKKVWEAIEQLDPKIQIKLFSELFSELWREPMKKIKIEAYRIHELPEKVKDVIYEEYQFINVNYDDWWQPILEMFNEKIQKEYGVSTRETGVEFDLYRRYARLHYEIDDFRKLLSAFVPESDILAFEFKRDKRIEDLLEIHLDKRRVEVWYDDEDYEMLKELIPEIDDLDTMVEGLLSDLDGEFLKMLDKEWEYQTSKEAVFETLDANDFMFTIKGKRLDHLFLEE